MTFNEWMRSHEPKHCDSDDSLSLRLLRKCWKDARQDEREACARCCDAEVDPEWPVDDLSVIAMKCAAAIRARKD